MEEQAQRELLKSAVERGLTIKDLYEEIGQDFWGIARPYVPPARPPEPPHSACPVVQEILQRAGAICAAWSPPTDAFYQNLLWQAEELLEPSSEDTQEYRAGQCVEWFMRDFLGYVEKDQAQPPPHKVIEACRLVMRAEELSAAGCAAAVMDAALIIFSGISERLSALNLKPGVSATCLMAGSHLNRDLMLKLCITPGDSEIPKAPAARHVHPDGDLDAALSAAEQAALPAELLSGEELAARLGMDPADLDRQLTLAEAAAGVHGGATAAPGVPVQHGADLDPGGVLKK